MPKGKKMRRLIMGPMSDLRSRLFMALASDQRLRILLFLKDGPKNSQQIINEIGLDPSVISRHLMLLRNVGLVSAYKEGVLMFFKVDDERVFQIIDLATGITKDWLEQIKSQL
jgi:ArsR family transcriptional regulator